MEDRSLEFSDNRLFSVFRYCNSSWKYAFPATSGSSQSDFDARFGGAVRDILRVSLPKMLFLAHSSPVLWTLTEDTFGSAAESLKLAFSSDDKCLILMVHVAMLAVFFVRLYGKKDARSWVFRIICRHAKRCDFRRQCVIRFREPRDEGIPGVNYF